MPMNKLVFKLSEHNNLGDSLPEVDPVFGMDYVHAANGVFKRGANQFYEAAVRVKNIDKSEVPGLKDFEEYFLLKIPKIDVAILKKGLEIAQRFAESSSGPLEAMFFINSGTNSSGRLGYFLDMPAKASLSGVSVACAAPDSKRLVAEFHSHHEMTAFFSQTDDSDETEFRVYGVLGKVLSRPSCRFRLGVYGDFLEIPARSLFSGDLSFIEDLSKVRSDH